ncbi:MAG TPA: phosphoethanolamine transferase [Puia sp.]|nr:phosphoethanolamine transferase [Puia sp.]
MVAKQNSPNTSFSAFLIIVGLVATSDLIYFIINPPHADAIFRLLTCVSALLIPLYLFRNYVRLYAWLFLPVFILIPFSIFAIVFFNLPINSTLVLSVTNTTRNEATELIGRYIWLFLAVAVATIGLYILLVKRVPAHLPSSFCFRISLWSLVLCLAIPWFDTNPETLHRGYATRIRANIYATFPFSVGYCAYLVVNQYHMIKESEKDRANFRFGAQQEPFCPTNEKQLFVLIIGESSRADHWGIYGYDRMTSPRMSKQKNLISFSNVSAGAPFTQFAVPQIITCATAENFEEHFKERSIVSLFKEAGFNTYWITDQQDEAHIRIHEQEADELYLATQRPSTEVTLENTDMQLVTQMEQVLREPGVKKFIVMHTWGSHFDYSNRYPSMFDVFQPSLKTVFARPSDFSKKNVLVNSYDNTILFTDAVIDSVISVVRQQAAISSVFYISDHGENLFDDSKHLSLHEEVIPTIYTAHIPFFVWYSDSLQNIFPSKVEWLREHHDSKIGVEDVIHTVADLCNIRFNLKDSTKCIDRGTFVNSKQKILGENYKIYFYDSLPTARH